MPPFAAVATPSAMIHCSPPCHADRSLPSNSTIASDGTEAAAVGPGPTSIKVGFGQTMPLLYSSMKAAPATTPVSTSPKPSNPTTRRVFMAVILSEDGHSIVIRDGIVFLRGFLIFDFRFLIENVELR